MTNEVVGKPVTSRSKLNKIEGLRVVFSFPVAKHKHRRKVTTFHLIEQSNTIKQTFFLRLPWIFNCRTPLQENSTIIFRQILLVRTLLGYFVNLLFY